MPTMPAGAQAAMGGMAQKAMGSGVAQKAQQAAQQAVVAAASEEAKKQMSNAFSAGLSGASKGFAGMRK